MEGIACLRGGERLERLFGLARIVGGALARVFQPAIPLHQGNDVRDLVVAGGDTRSASVRAKEDSVVLEWPDEAFRTLLLRDPALSQRIFGQALRTLVEKEKSLIESLVKEHAAGNS